MKYLITIITITILIGCGASNDAKQDPPEQRYNRFDTVYFKAYNSDAVIYSIYPYSGEVYYSIVTLTDPPLQIENLPEKYFTPISKPKKVKQDSTYLEI